MRQNHIGVRPLKGNEKNRKYLKKNGTGIQEDWYEDLFCPVQARN